MKKIISILIIALMLSQNVSFASEDYTSFFKKDNVIDIKIELPEADYNDMIENAMDEKYHSATVTVDGVTVENTGIRTKGNSTLTSISRSESDRYSFRIKFDKYVEGQTLLGLDELVLNNMYADPSYMREYLAYEAMREAGLTVPLTVFTNIYINGELKGFYLCVESLDDSFVARNFENESGNLYKQESGSTLIYKENNSYASSELKLGSDIEKVNLKNMIQVLNSGENLEDVLDVDSALGYIAANFVLGSFDSYSGQFAQNYYLYDDNGVFSVIPWDYNMAFGGFGNGLNATVDEPVSGVNMADRPLINKLLSNEKYKSRYLEYVDIFKDYISNLQTRVDSLAQIIRPYVENDPTKFVTMEQFENNIVYMEEQDKGQDRPGFEKNENMQPPNFDENFKPEMGRPEGDGNKGGGGGMMQKAGSIITYATKRLASLNNNAISVYLNNDKLSFDVNPIIENDRTLVPLRTIFEALNMNVNYENNEIIATNESTTIKLKIGETIAYRNDEELILDVAPKIVNERTLVPLRFIAESVDLNVEVNEGVTQIYLSK